MDEIIIKEMVRTKAWLIALFLCSACLTIFFVNGVYSAFWNVPKKNVEIAELTDERDHWQARAKSLDKYIETREGQYRVACKFDNLFMMIADPDQVISFEALDGYIKTRKEFFEPVEAKQGG